jgi:NitT/TauT family transport system permease protein/sulfonate transport system permease protein
MAVRELATDGPLVALLLAWIFLAKHVSAYILPRPNHVVHQAFDLLGGDASLATNTWITFERVLIAVGISTVVGSALVLIPRYVRLTSGFILRRLMPFLNAMPALGWAILGLFWFHVSSTGVIFVEIAILLPFVMINMAEGVKELDGELLEMSASFTRRSDRTCVLSSRSCSRTCSPPCVSLSGRHGKSRSSPSSTAPLQV